MNSGRASRRPVTIKVLVIVIGFFAFMGFVSGALLLLGPSGRLLGLQHDILDDAPVGDFTLVGIWFVVLFGLLPSFAIYGLVSKRRWEWTDPINAWTGHLWGWTASVAVGALMLLWTAIEIALLGLLTGIGGTLQIMISIWGILTLGLTALPSVRKDMRMEKQSS